MKAASALMAMTVLSFVAHPVESSDWPMWRHDAERSGATPHSLGNELSLKWTWKLGLTTPAWPASQTKLQFDAGYEPICASGRVVIGSPVDGRVIAIDITTGHLAWTYFTEGPVRFAPTVSDGRVYVGSDDGYLHCLSLGDGTLEWKVLGGPKRRRIIGNDRLISMWPIRGGVVIQDNVACFSAGIWPSMGVFVRAVNAQSGDVLWTNSTTGSRFITHPHGADSFGSISPQGYLAIAGDTLLVPGGRTLPAGFDLSTGELRHFEFGGKGAGGFEVLTSGNWYFVAGNLFRATDGASAGRVPARITGRDGIIGNDGSSIVVTRIEDDPEESIETDRRGNKSKRLTVKSERVSQFTADGPSRVFLQSGSRIFTAEDGQLAEYDTDGTGTSRSPAWTSAVQGNVWSMIAANDCLIVTTREGDVACFGASGVSDPSSRVFTNDDRDGASEPLASTTIPSDRQHAKHVTAAAEGHQGYAVSLGVPTLATLGRMLNDTELHVIVLEPDSTETSQFRKRTASDFRFGRRVTVIESDIEHAHLPPYLASFVFSRSSALSAGSIRELFQILRPYGGTCCIPTDDQQHQTIARTASALALPNGSVLRDGNWTMIRREGALPDSGVWSHQYGDATNSVVSADARVKPPFGVLWFGGPPNDRILPRHGHGPSPQVAGGRLFIEGPDMLRCVDVYTGRVWWERDLPGLGEYYNNTSHHPGAGEIGSNYVSIEDSVYVVFGKQLLELDSRTGEPRRDLELNSGESTTWSSVLVEGDVVIATANPVAVDGSDGKPEATLPPNSTTLIPANAEWSYLAGADPRDEWVSLEFDARGWKKDKAGFGYGDGDDRTVLKDMPGKYSRLYIRREFELSDPTAAKSLLLAINYDDAFIVWLNGHEVHRVNVKSGRGAGAKSIGSHEAGGTELIALKDASKWLKPGRNVLAIEGHNTSISSSDFSLDPWLVAVPRTTTPSADAPGPRSSLADLLKTTKYSSASRLLVAFDRQTGRELWSRKANFNFRHNALCAAGSRLFCIDALSSTKLAALRRRGVAADEEPQLLALDAMTGEELWSTKDDVFGTFLSYSRDHDVLVQGGSAYRDRAKDEVKQGMVAYRGSSGEVVWKDLGLVYGGPCMLRHDRIITNGGGGFELDLHTGERTGWSYQRMYGCNTAIGSEHLLTFRSGAAGFCDLFSDSGTGNLGGFRSSCTSNLVVADGVLNAPDYTRTCSCAYQLQTSLALIHDPDNEFWAFGHTDYTSRPASSIGINLGAPGDRRDADGILWFDYPVVGGPSPELDVEIEPANVSQFGQHSSLMARGSLNWVGASGLRGARTIRLKSSIASDAGRVSLRLVFAEPDGLGPGQRVFDVLVNGKRVLKEFDIAGVVEDPLQTIIRDFDVAMNGMLEVQLVPATGSEEPVIAGLAISTVD